MVVNKDLEKIKQISAQTLERIEKEGLPPHPDIYELWFSYYAGTHPEITRAIDILQKAGKPFTEKYCADLAARYLQDLRTEKMVEKAETAMTSIMHEVMQIVTGAKETTGELGESLAKSNSEMKQVKNVDDLKKVMTAMLTDTQKVAMKNKELEAQLKDSSSRMDQLKTEVEAVRKEAKTDGLTGLVNRKAFDDIFQARIRESARENRALSLLLLDIDHFKVFNDTHGHQVGDQVLRLVAKTLNDMIRGKDTAARYGGEEFAIILPETNLTAAVAVGNNLRRAIAGKELVNRNTGEPIGRITASLGAAEIVVGEKPTEVIERADQALYQAKEKGRDQVCAAPKSGDVRHTA